MFEAELRLFQEEGITLDLPTTTLDPTSNPTTAVMVGAADAFGPNGAGGASGGGGNLDLAPTAEQTGLELGLKFEFPDSTECMGVLLGHCNFTRQNSKTQGPLFELSDNQDLKILNCSQTSNL